MNLRIMSFNTQHCKNYISKKIEYKKIAKLIKDNNIDIVGLNEIYGIPFFKKYFSQCGKIAKLIKYNHFFGTSTHLHFLPYGNALLSKYPILKTKVIKIPYPKVKIGNKYYEKRSILKAEILVNDAIITVFITHLGLNFDEQENGINTLIKCVDGNNSIIMGDFNINEKNILLKELDSKFNNTSIKIKNNIYSFPSKKPKIKIDYIYTSKDIKIVSSEIINEIISDHLPIIAEIKTSH